MTKNEIESLKQFVRAIVRTRCWDLGVETDGGTIQDLAEQHGIITPFECTQEHLDTSFLDADEIEVGDTAYRFSDWMKRTSVAQSKVDWLKAKPGVLEVIDDDLVATIRFKDKTARVDAYGRVTWTLNEGAKENHESSV